MSISAAKRLQHTTDSLGSLLSSQISIQKLAWKQSTVWHALEKWQQVIVQCQ